MAERRMFAKSIVLSDSFLDMPMSARCLYFTLCMLADDDGFVNSPKSIMRQCGASIDDMNILIGKKFVIGFESGVLVIKHWLIHNYIRKDTYNETKYMDEKGQLFLDENNAYSEHPSTGRGRVVDESLTQDRIGKDRIGKNNIYKFEPPTLQEVQEYCSERDKGVDAKQFYDYYTAQDWKDSSGKAVKNWKGKMIAVWENKPQKSITSKTICNSKDEMSKYQAKNGGIDFDVL